MGLFEGKKGLILGVANEHSIAWAIAQQIMAEGGVCGFSHLPDRPDDDHAPELRLALVDALARLTVEDRAVLVLRHAEDHSVETVATILGVSASVVKMRNARALARLRALLGDDFLDR